MRSSTRPRRVAKAASSADKWDGPTTGPKAVGKKTVVYVAGDMRNGGILGVSQGVKEAAAAIGWDYREIDGQGSVSGQATALSQAIALKPDAIIVGGSDAVEQKAGLEAADKEGIMIVGWHSGPKPGPIDGAPVFANVTTDAMEVAKVAAKKAIANSDGKAGVVIFADFDLCHRHRQGPRHGGRDQEMLRLHRPVLPGHAARRRLDPHAAAHHDAAPAERRQVDAFAGDQRPLLRLHATGALGRRHRRRRDPQNISAGDGSESAYQRIRAKDHQTATVPEPLAMQGWQLVDEFNRAFAGEKWSGYVRASTS